MFTYITPLTHMSMKNFVLISNFARIPGIVLSTYAAAGLSGNIVESVIIFAVTAAVAIVALVVYGRVTKKTAPNGVREVTFFCERGAAPQSRYCLTTL